jgi:hypothetical protein
VPINLTDLRRGVNERHPATLPEGFVEQAWNITYDRSQLGARRNGSQALVSPIKTIYVARSLHVHTPDSTAANERLWAFLNDDTFRFYTSAWASTDPSVSPADTFTGFASFASLHGKLFIACDNNSTTRLHVYDGTNIRRVGLKTPTAAPTAADTGAGTLSGTRYYRVRYAVLSGSTVLLRSEPSATLTFTPSGGGAAVRVTKPAAINEGETHWELEESIDNANFYRIATTVVGTTTYDDSLATSAVATSGTLSATIGDYTVPESARFLVVDRDRLLMFGNHEDATKDSDLTWTVVGTDTTGVGNDERVPTATGNRLTIDGGNGGRLTGARAYDSQVIAFKKKGVYLVSHTRNRVGAYVFERLTPSIGAVEGSLCDGVDERGQPALYFLDDALGPMRFGARGFEQLAPQLQSTFQSYFNASAASSSANAMYVPKRREVHFNIAVNNSAGNGDWPGLTMVYNIETGGVSWSFIADTDNYLAGKPIYACVTWNNLAYVSTDNGPSGGGVLGTLAQIDVAGATQDFGVRPFRAYIRTKAFAPDPNGINKRITLTGGVLGARPLAATSVSVSAIRDHGKEIKTVTASLAPNAATNPSAADERFVTVPLDDFVMAEATVLQFELGDASRVAVTPWSLEQFTGLLGKDGQNVAGR